MCKGDAGILFPVLQQISVYAYMTVPISAPLIVDFIDL